MEGERGIAFVVEPGDPGLEGSALLEEEGDDVVTGAGEVAEVDTDELDADGVLIVRVGGLGDEGEGGADVEGVSVEILELIVFRSGKDGRLEEIAVPGEGDGGRDVLDGGEFDYHFKFARVQGSGLIGRRFEIGW